MALWNNRTLEDQFVWRYRNQGKTDIFIWEAFDEARGIIPLTRRGIKRALNRYALFQKVRYFNLHHARNFGTRVKERLDEKLEKAIEEIRQDPAVQIVKVFDKKIHHYNKICSNCGSRIDRVISARIKYTRILMGRDDGERGYFLDEREQAVHYPCDNCGAVQRR